MTLDRRYFLAGTAWTATPLLLGTICAQKAQAAVSPQNQTTLSAAIYNFNNRIWNNGLELQLDNDVQLVTLQGQVKKTISSVMNYLKGKVYVDVEKFDPILGQQWWSADGNTVIGFADWTDNDNGNTASIKKPIAYVFRFNPTNHLISFLYGTQE